MVLDTIINTNVFKKICRYAFLIQTENLAEKLGRKYYQFLDSVKYFKSC